MKSVYECRKMCSNSDSIKEGAELRIRGERRDAVDAAARRHKIFNDCTEYLPALSSRLQVLHRFSYLLNKNSQVQRCFRVVLQAYGEFILCLVYTNLCFTTYEFSLARFGC